MLRVSERGLGGVSEKTFGDLDKYAAYLYLNTSAVEMFYGCVFITNHYLRYTFLRERKQRTFLAFLRPFQV